jgi:hypothetical protein
MSTHSANIDRLRIAAPCPISWEQMTGNSQVRFCDHCQLNVYNISELSRTDAEKLIASTEGRLCARVFKREDGTILTKDCPVGVRALRRRVAKRTATVFTALVSLSAGVFGQQSAKDKKTSCTPQVKITRTVSSPNHAAKILTGAVLDPVGAVISGAEVQLINAKTQEILQTCTNDQGRFEFEPLEVGTYLIKIHAENFKRHEITNIIIEKDKVINLDVILEFSNATEIVGVLMGDSSLIDTPPGTTIISEQMIRRLPNKK